MSLPHLSADLLAQRPDLLPGYSEIAALPEKIIQFGTGVLLRGLPDYFVNKANQKGIFNGRIVVVKSTSSGDTASFQAQDNIFSHVIRGIENGTQVDEFELNCAISRTLSASAQWEQILECARNPELKIVLSNTTEVGIQYVQDDLSATPPVSFPGKLTAYLLERFEAFEGSPQSGMVIVPTELIVDNGKKLREIVLRQARENNTSDAFIAWLENHNHFCSSLVDRIVPGKPEAATAQEVFDRYAFTDNLLIVSEVYRLWAIEGGEHVKSILSFAEADQGVVIAPDIDLFRELKLRLLNGTHTLSSGYCFLKGLEIVSQSLQNPETATFISDLMLNELAPAIPYAVDSEKAREFGQQVLDRFRNPFIRHQLLDITVQYTAKMKMRNIPTLLQHYKNSSEAPLLFAKGFAAYLKFMHPVSLKEGIYYGDLNGKTYPIRCDSAAYFYEKWQNAESAEDLARTVLSDVSVWETDLALLPGFAEAVCENINDLVESGS